MITYRVLLPIEVKKYSFFLKQRSLDSLRMYFGYAITPEQIDLITEGIENNPSKHTIVIAEDIDNEIVGTVHIADMGDACVEFGVMVAEAYRGQGIANGLLEYSIVWSRNRGYSDLYMHCLSYNGPIKHLVRKHGLLIETQGTESDASLKIPPTNIFSVGHELALRQQSAFNYGLKHNIQSFKRALAL